MGSFLEREFLIRLFLDNSEPSWKRQIGPLKADALKLNQYPYCKIKK